MRDAGRFCSQIPSSAGAHMTKKRQARAISKTVKQKSDSLPEPNSLLVAPRDGETQAETLARHSLDPEMQGAVSIRNFEGHPFTGGSINVLVRQLAAQIKLSNQGDLSRSEALLTVQAHTLDAIFHKIARVAAANLEYVDHFETLLRLALKAQSQCRSTIETLAEIKNPSHVAFVKQANIANGPQQVNNDRFESCTRAPAREINSRQNKLLEQTNGERLDFRAEGEAGETHTSLETVGAVNGTKKRGG